MAAAASLCICQHLEPLVCMFCRFAEGGSNGSSSGGGGEKPELDMKVINVNGNLMMGSVLLGTFLVYNVSGIGCSLWCTGLSVVLMLCLLVG